MALSIDQQNTSHVVQLAQILSDPHLLGAACAPVLGFHFWVVVRSRLQPLHMVIDRVTAHHSGWEGLEKFLRSLLGLVNSRVEIVALLKIYIFKEIAADRPNWN